MVLAAAAVVVSGLMGASRCRRLERFVVWRLLMTLVIILTAVGGIAATLTVAGVPDTPLRFVAGLTCAAAAAGAMAAMPIGGRAERRSVVEDGGAPHRKPAIEFGLHSELTRE